MIQQTRDVFEAWQVMIYFGAVATAAALALSVPGTGGLETAINPALAFMLFVQSSFSRGTLAR